VFIKKSPKLSESVRLETEISASNFFLIKQDLMEEVKPKLDEEIQDILDCLGSGAEEDATKLYEAMKVSKTMLLFLQRAVRVTRVLEFACASHNQSEASHQFL